MYSKYFNERKGTYPILFNVFKNIFKNVFQIIWLG